MAHTVQDFLRAWEVLQCYDLMATYVNTGKTITFEMDTPPANHVRCTTSSGYSKIPSINWASTHFSAVPDPSNPTNTMLRSQAGNTSEGGVDGNDVTFRIMHAPGGGQGTILALISGLDGSGAWNGGED